MSITLDSVGLGSAYRLGTERNVLTLINLKLALLGAPTLAKQESAEFHEISKALLPHHREAQRLLADYLCPADQRVQDFLDSYLEGTGSKPRLPSRTFVLDRYGLARVLSIPVDKEEFKSQIISSYRIKQGVLHNPVNDRRTTKGVFHVCEGGAPISADKIAVPRNVFGRMLEKALEPTKDLLTLPFTATQENPAECFVSLLLRPVICPEVPGVVKQKSLEVRFFAPGSMVSNLDFVESIFGNAGDPFLPENDAALDGEHWVGHTGCVILAPHLTSVSKKEAGLPPYDTATERQKRNGMCWKTPDEKYNNGTAFKLTCRDSRGVMVTIIADNYFGYCKKEVKTQISYSANLYGNCEEEHAGGAKVYRTYDLGEEFRISSVEPNQEHSFEKHTIPVMGDRIDIKADGYAVDKKFPSIIYVPEDAIFELQNQSVWWNRGGKKKKIKLLADKIYVKPSGYRVEMEKPPGDRAWRLVGTIGAATVCHKPCTVSGGGKSEISKPITDAVIQGPVFISDFQKDFDSVAELLAKDYSDRFAEVSNRGKDKRPILSIERSLGSVIKLLTPDYEEYSVSYNQWLQSIPQHIKELVFVVKRFYKEEWGDKWRSPFSVDIINGTPGYELKCAGRKLVSNYLRVGYEADGSWRVFGLRKDFHPASKIQMEDDITASVVVPVSAVPFVASEQKENSVKIVHNCEYRLFQRPDDAIHRGYDKQTELDFTRNDNFLSNYEPLTPKIARELVEDAIGFLKFTPPMQQLIHEVSMRNSPGFFASTAHPRLVDGKPSKNPRYLQVRPDLLNAQAVYLAEVSERLHRNIANDKPLLVPVSAVLPGRRNNPPEPAANIRALAVYNPIHYMELPELFMEFICSMTGKSPSTTGAGSEGALTKGPFNAMPPIIDLNNALVGYLLTQGNGFVTAAGYVGPKCRVDHDVSLLIPEVWSRMNVKEREPGFLIKGGYLEKCDDFEHKGTKVLASRLGYRVTSKFVNSFFGRIFSHPHLVFPEHMLRPELQDMKVFVDGMDNIVTTQKRVADLYFEDGTIEAAVPPLKALLHIMRDGTYKGNGLASPEVRSLFTLEHLLSSEWYKKRLLTKQEADKELWKRHVDYAQTFLARRTHAREADRLDIASRLEFSKGRLNKVSNSQYLEELRGTIGLDPYARGGWS